MVQLFYGTFLTEGIREGKVCLVSWFLGVTGPHCCVLQGDRIVLKAQKTLDCTLALAFVCVTMDTESVSSSIPTLSVCAVGIVFVLELCTNELYQNLCEPTASHSLHRLCLFFSLVSNHL